MKKKSKTKRKSLKTWDKRPEITKFLLELENHGNASMAMEAADVSRGTIWSLRKLNPDFDAVFKEARNCGLGILRDHGHKMAMGVLDEEVFKVSDGPMLRFLVQQHDRSFNPTQKVELGGDGLRPFMFKMVLDEQAMKDEKNGA